MKDVPFHCSCDCGGSLSPDVVHLLAGLRSLLAVGHEPVRSLRLWALVSRLAVFTICFAAGFVVAENVAVRAVAGLHGPRAPSLVAPVLRFVLSVVSPGAHPPVTSPEPGPDGCPPVGAHSSPRDGWYQHETLGLHGYTLNGRLISRSPDPAFALSADGPSETCGLTEAAS